ncbi:MAG: adenylate/guanylate cyclase domain-containing protein [Sulfurimonas sp.]|uniref:adenylate/guanylate cyclase domain-containing protein n=1 Tax=Sulfurimonas sp. TaxID=2022749 RepID=UPI00261260C4|nr:adenylate/guanylate cyclase domain-containing protein [Sulfurimonas sp.]MDD2653034.1 adenylate/guanylate cyclase domain-containing protein [Sulfurimonas sp.]MDD3452273.1 adenylate/guanylate cyclase domain-containing protein [Sulfurimonas sp.]
MKKDIEDKVKEIIDTNFTVEDITYVPDLEDTKLTFGNKGLRFHSTVLYIDMRESTKVLNNHNRPTVAKLHMAYFHIIVKIAKSLGGEVRSFNGDGMLVFFQGTTKSTLSNAVKAAMKMKYMITQDEIIRKKFEKYSPIDFGIGLDHGKILCTKVGINGTNNRDLVWIGNVVNKSVKVGDKLSSPYHIGISSFVYDNLTDEVKYHVEKDSWGYERKVDMWQESSFIYNDQYQKYYYTSYYWSVE